jgi:hypothetical protein
MQNHCVVYSGIAGIFKGVGWGVVPYEQTYHYLVLLGGRVFLATPSSDFLGVIRSRS